MMGMRIVPTWKRAISEQKMEQLRMSEEEMFSIF